MRTWQLTMRPAKGTLREACAWLLPGGDPRFWCEILLRHAVDFDHIQLLLIPKSGNDLTAQSVLVLGDDKHKLPATSIWPLYGKMGHCLYLPVDGQLEPSVSDTELSRLLLSGQRSYVLHPTAGLLVFEEHDRLRPDQIFRKRPARDTRWNFAQTGVFSNERLWTIGVEARPSLDAFMTESGEGIGSEDPMSMDDGLLDGGSPESEASSESTASSGGVERIWRQIRSKLRQRWRRVVRQLKPQQAFYQLRELLERNPDAGLRYAPPLRDESTTARQRSQSDDGFRLFGRDIRFRVSDLQRATWGDRSAPIPLDAFCDLHRIYQDLAMREVRLGRYRRAAYILGFLLNDLHRAASVLSDGGHYHEAAEVYLKIKHPAAAAECFERGGFWQEAIELWTQAANFKRLAAIYERLGDHDAARQAHRQLADQLEKENDYYAAAQVWSDQLHELDRAITVLESGIGWGQLALHDPSPQANQFVTCLQALWKLRDDRKEHDWMRLWLRKCRDDLSVRLKLMLLEELVHFSHHTTDESLRRAAADTTRVVASQLLRSQSPSRDRIVRCIQQLDRHDLLLQRDGDRYLRPAKSKGVTRAKTSSLTLIATSRLPSAERWICALSDTHSFVALGLTYSQSYLCLCSMRTAWIASSSSWAKQIHNEKRMGRLSSSLIFEPNPNANDATCLFSPTNGGIDLPDLPAMGALPALSIKTPWWFPIRTVALTTVDGHWMCVERKSVDRLELSTWMAGKLVASRPLEHLTASHDKVFIRNDRGQICVASGNALEIIRSSSSSLAAHYPSPVRCVIRLGQGGLFVVTEEAIYVDHLDSIRTEGVVRSLRVVCDGLRDPMAKPIAPDRILVAHQEGVMLFRIQDETAFACGTHLEANGPPCAILSTNDPSQIAVLSESGTLQRFECNM